MMGIMIVRCDKCEKYFNDVYRFTFCPHKTFLANDGTNHFDYYDESYISKNPPTTFDEKFNDSIVGKYRGIKIK